MSYTNKTQPTTISPQEYLRENFTGKDQVQRQTLILIDLYTKITRSPCVMWNKIFGFGQYHYLDSKGGEHTHLRIGFAVSSTGFTLYNMMGWKKYAQHIEKLGKYKLSGISCLAIKNIDDIDLGVLAQVIKQTVSDMKKTYTHKT
jgi:hypothetical protein